LPPVTGRKPVFIPAAEYGYFTQNVGAAIFFIPSRPFTRVEAFLSFIRLNKKIRLI
jgi:hypothetical protein